ncbi:MAG TPA: YbjN domain-containing protein [Solirubrobacteraceae bacterium]|jgi:hypothetical protein|nr:YbjN domain-containing protein [Solirubrobacteraceae bacterium]
MKATYDAVVASLRSAGRPVEEHEDEGRAAIEGYGANGDWMMVTQVYGEPRAVAVYAVPHDRVPPQRRQAMALLLCRLNSELVLGNFELDLDDGELRFKTTLEIGDDAPTTAQLEQVIALNLTTTDRYLPTIEAVVAGTGADEAWQSSDQ